MLVSQPGVQASCWLLCFDRWSLCFDHWSKCFDHCALTIGCCVLTIGSCVLTIGRCVLTHPVSVQLIKDMVSVSEATSWSMRPGVQAKYRALRCNISHVETGSAEHKNISEDVLTSIDR